MRLDEARARIEKRSDLHAFISVTDEAGEGPVVAVKDLVDVRGTVTTAGAIILPNSLLTRTAMRCHRRLKALTGLAVATAWAGLCRLASDCPLAPE